MENGRWPQFMENERWPQFLENGRQPKTIKSKSKGCGTVPGNFGKNNFVQAGAELCQAQAKFGLTMLDLIDSTKLVYDCFRKYRPSSI